MEETVLVAQLYHAIIGALGVQDTFIPLYPAELSAFLRDAVCTKGLKKETSLDLLHVIEQLAAFRAGVKSRSEFSAALEGRPSSRAASAPGVNVSSNRHRSVLVNTFRVALSRSLLPSTEHAL